MAVHPPVAKFPEVDHADASGELAEIYDDIEFTLRAPWVPFAVRVMSLFPAFVPAAWQALKPQISTVYAEKGADLVREASIIPGPLPPDRRPRLRAAGRSEEEISKIREALDSLNYGNPKGLILITAWNEAWNERAAGCPANSLSAAQARPLPGGLPAALGRFPGDQQRRHQDRPAGGHLGGQLGRDGESVLDRVDPGGHGQPGSAEGLGVGGHPDSLPVRLVDQRRHLFGRPDQRAVPVAALARGRVHATAGVDLQDINAVRDLGPHGLPAGVRS